jgi:3-oxoacid CoA-transferase
MKAVKMVITDLAVFKFDGGQLTLVEVMPGATLEEVTRKTSAKFLTRLMN